MQTDKPRCEICTYHDLTPNGGRGRCRRFPPAQLSGPVNTMPSEWCGEYNQDAEKLLKVKQKIQENDK